MKKLWEISGAFLRRHRDWCLFVITVLGMICWGMWYLAPKSDELRLRLAWEFDGPPQEFTLGELHEYITETTRRCEALKREAKELRGITSGSQEEKQMEDLLATSTWSANTESHIQYTYNLWGGGHRLEHGEQAFFNFTPRQRRIIQFGELIDTAHSLRSKEGLLTALVASGDEPTKIEGFYTNYRELELVVARTAEGYQVRLGGCYGNSRRAYGYDFVARREGDTLIGKAGILQGGEEPAEQVTLVIEFKRGIAQVKGGEPLGQGTLVKLADLRANGRPLGTDFTLGAGACSPDEWEGRRAFLRNEVTWLSEARPAFFWDAHYVYRVAEEALGGPRRGR
jgi:hypothetical protein